MAKDPTAVTQKWLNNTSAAGQAYTDGVNAVQVAPGRAAAAAADLWATNVAQAKTKFQRNSAAVSLDEWKTQATTKGAQRLASGVQGAQAKYQAFIVKHLQIVDSVRNSLPPRGNTQQNIQRAVAMMNGVHNAYNS